MVLYFEKELKFACGNGLSEGLQLVNYCEVLEGGLSEIRWKAVTLDVDGYDSKHTMK